MPDINIITRRIHISANTVDDNNILSKKKEKKRKKEKNIFKSLLSAEKMHHYPSPSDYPPSFYGHSHSVFPPTAHVQLQSNFQTNTGSQKPFRYRSFAEYHKHYVLRKKLLRRQRSLLRRQFLASFPASLLPQTKSPKSCLPERDLINTKYLFEEVLGTPPSYTPHFEKHSIGEPKEELEAEDLEVEMWFKMPESIFYLGTEDVAPLFLSAHSRNHIYPEEELACWGGEGWGRCVESSLG
ncbi:hypothetical protein RUND412_010957 [Rhizina undulata]